jgi:23S rRNA pseudouridine2605 synthase
MPSDGQADEAAEAGGERVAKALARAGVASRREVERLIAAGRVKLNGVVLNTPAVKVGARDVLTVDGRPVAAPEATRVWRYHKPVGLVTTEKDPQGRPTVFANLPPELPRVISVGRLDLNTEGLLLLTNDGALARALELPANALFRRYRARARGRGVTQALLDKLKQGATVDGVHYGPVDARLEPSESSGVNQWIGVTLAEGKNREVRKVLESVGLTVNRLIRQAYGPFDLGTLKPGEAVEVEPRVIRERLSRYLAEASLPTRSGAAAPGRVLKKKTEASAGEAPARSEPVKYKTGWAKPKKRVGPVHTNVRKTPKAAKARPSEAAGSPAPSKGPARPGRAASTRRSSAPKGAPPKTGGPKRR